MKRFAKAAPVLFSVTVLAAVTLTILPSAGLGMAAPGPYRIDELDPTAKVSYHSSRILRFLDRWPAPLLPGAEDAPESVRAIRTPGHSDVIGMVKQFVVKAPFAKAVETNEFFEDFPKIWENVVSVKVKERDRNRVVTEWTRKAPAFFLSRIHYTMSTVFDKSLPGRVVYRNQLIDGNMVKASDSLVVFDQVGTDRTRVSILNFFDPVVGPLRAFAEGKIWKESLRTGFKDDVAFRAKVEHPDWDVDRITEEAEKALDKSPIDEIEYADGFRFE